MQDEGRAQINQRDERTGEDSKAWRGAECTWPSAESSRGGLLGKVWGDTF